LADLGEDCTEANMQLAAAQKELQSSNQDRDKAIDNSNMLYDQLQICLVARDRVGDAHMKLSKNLLEVADHVIEDKKKFEQAIHEKYEAMWTQTRPNVLTLTTIADDDSRVMKKYIREMTTLKNGHQGIPTQQKIVEKRIVNCKGVLEKKKDNLIRAEQEISSTAVDLHVLEIMKERLDEQKAELEQFNEDRHDDRVEKLRQKDEERKKAARNRERRIEIIGIGPPPKRFKSSPIPPPANTEAPLPSAFEFVNLTQSADSHVPPPVKSVPQNVGTQPIPKFKSPLSQSGAQSNSPRGQSAPQTITIQDDDVPMKENTTRTTHRTPPRGARKSSEQPMDMDHQAPFEGASEDDDLGQYDD